MLEVCWAVASAAKICVSDGTGIDAAGIGETDSSDKVCSSGNVVALAFTIHKEFSNLAAQTNATIDAWSAIEHKVRALEATRYPISWVGEVDASTITLASCAVSSRRTTEALVRISIIASGAIGITWHAIIANIRHIA